MEDPCQVQQIKVENQDFDFSILEIFKYQFLILKNPSIQILKQVLWKIETLTTFCSKIVPLARLQQVLRRKSISCQQSALVKYSIWNEIELLLLGKYFKAVRKNSVWFCF